LAWGLLGNWMQTNVEHGLMMQMGCEHIHDCENGEKFCFFIKYGSKDCMFFFFLYKGITLIL